MAVDIRSRPTYNRVSLLPLRNAVLEPNMKTLADVCNGSA